MKKRQGKHTKSYQRKKDPKVEGRLGFSRGINEGNFLIKPSETKIDLKMATDHNIFDRTKSQEVDR